MRRTCIRTSFIRRKWLVSSKDLSKTTIGLLPFKQFPVILSSSIVCALSRWKRTEGPLGVREAHMYRSACLRASKNRAELQFDRSASSFSRESWCFVSNLASSIEI